MQTHLENCGELSDNALCVCGMQARSTSNNLMNGSGKTIFIVAQRESIGYKV